MECRYLHIRWREFFFCPLPVSHVSCCLRCNASTKSCVWTTADRMSMRLILAFTLCLQLIGGITYAIAEAADTPSLIIVGRLIAGIGSTNIAICQKFVISTSDLASRSKAIATMQVRTLCSHPQPLELSPAGCWLRRHCSWPCTQLWVARRECTDRGHSQIQSIHRRWLHARRFSYIQPGIGLAAL
jgi:hypothetical protein